MLLLLHEIIPKVQRKPECALATVGQITWIGSLLRFFFGWLLTVQSTYPTNRLAISRILNNLLMLTAICATSIPLLFNQIIYMSDYSRLIFNSLPFNAPQEDVEKMVNNLIDIWLDGYQEIRSGSDAVVVRLREGLDMGTNGREIELSYLFDVAYSRLIAAWAFSQGRNSFPRERDNYRMRKIPRIGGSDYHRGHGISHLTGGRTDINLVPQLGFVNSGQFQKLELDAVSNPGALYFSCWIYEKNSIGVIPVAVEQGLMIRGCPLNVSLFRN